MFNRHPFSAQAHLRISVGNKQEVGEGGRSVGHFVLLQSWMPLEEDPMKQTACPFGVGSKTPRQHSADTVSGELHGSCASGAAMPASDEEEPVNEAAAVEGLPRTWPDVLSLMRGEALPADARQLLEYIPVQQEWKRVRTPSNKVRDAMLKLGKFWQVPRKVTGQMRPPSEVAEAVEANMLNWH